MTTTPTVDCDVTYIKGELPTSSWDTVVRRLRAASVADALSVLSIHILVDERGQPIVWTEPRCKRLEPRTRARTVKELLEILGG